MGVERLGLVAASPAASAPSAVPAAAVLVVVVVFGEQTILAA